jgi:DnaJ-class molecular chaperone
VLRREGRTALVTVMGGETCWSGSSRARSTCRCVHTKRRPAAVCRKRISLRVPPGVDDGSRLRVRGEGDAGKK